MKIVTILGNRPHFIKSAIVSKAIAKTDIKEIIVHTGQHYSYNLSNIFFKEFQLKNPNYTLKSGSFSHGKQTGIMLQGIENILLKEKPDFVMVYGDTNSTLAGALAAAKLKIKVIHIEAGLRSYNKKMPEEINRILTDHVSSVLLCPTKLAVKNLKKEGLKGIFTGDVSYDVFLAHASSESLKINDKGKYYFCTIHRQENTTTLKLKMLFEMLGKLDEKVIIPIHPRTKQFLYFKISPNIEIIEPLDYINTLRHINNSIKVITDSGGVQRESYYLKKPCITMREEMEFPETQKGNWNALITSQGDKTFNYAKFLTAVNNTHYGRHRDFFGDGMAYQKIVKILLSL